jgi:prepilin-type processing-associated H-X9-DG protein
MLDMLAPTAGAPAATHYPIRHNDGMNALFYDGHVVFKKPALLRDSDFRIPGSPPPTAVSPFPSALIQRFAVASGGVFRHKTGSKATAELMNTSTSRF